ncbi:hypothetical protein COU54_02105 [Candidatus Pacearchaeota archaeon CG10_big_fil_rev_8_21_14_0_10_31_24]|nr:MAG: hypothetical protein COU54_02105 [Candidatus Pacearchaeota archaeon CG10_big_fil_rev_8_21_14_0_10_31_24]
MIKKNTKIVIDGEENKNFESLQGGIPLSIGEKINIHENSEVVIYEVKDKKIDCFFENEDQIVNVAYVLKRKLK